MADSKEPQHPRRKRGKGPIIHPADKARQGHIVLRTKRRRTIFIVGLVGLAILALLSRLFGAV